MSAEPPAAWTQVCPRSVRLAPSGLLVPAATLKVLLERTGHQDLLYTGFALEPSVRDGDTVHVTRLEQATPGDLILFDVGGWGDLLRGLRRSAAGAWTAALDAFPRRRAVLSADQVLGVARSNRRVLMRGLAIAGLHSWRAPMAWLRFRWRRVERAPEFADPEAADQSVIEKYRQQVSGYRTLNQSTLSDDLVRILAGRVEPGGSVLVGGSGAGSEAIHLAGLGYVVTGFDALPEMVSASREAARDSGQVIEFVRAGIDCLDLPGRRFDAIYLTPSLYSFIAGRSRRIGALRRLARHLAPGGCLILSFQPYRDAFERIETALAVARRRRRGLRAIERGDWYTWFLTPQGTIGSSYLHRFAAGEAEEELGTAGFRVTLRPGGHVLAEPSSGSGSGA